MFHSNDFGSRSGDDEALPQSPLERPASLRHSKVTGQPEFSLDFERAILELHAGMRDVAAREGMKIELADCFGVQNRAFYFEAWIS